MNPSDPIGLQGFLDATPDACVVVDQTGTIAMANGLAARMFGHGPNELVGKHVDTLVPERFRSGHIGYRTKYFSELGTRLMGEGRELAGRRKDGSEFAVEISLSPLRTPDGVFVISIIRDTTRHRQAETKFRGLLESAPDGIVVVDSSGHIALVNNQIQRMFGYSREELVGRPVEVLVPDRFKHLHTDHRAAYASNPKVRPMGAAGMSLTGRKRDGTEFPVEISLSPMQTDEGLLVSAAIRDISTRKAMEDQLRASLEEKEILLQEIHHRVKNNLQIVSSMLNLQMAQVTDSETRNLFQESQTRVRSIALFHEKLYQSRDLARVDIREYLKGVATGLFATYGVHPDEVVLSVRVDDLPIGVDAAISCGLIVNELLSNALKYAFPPGRKGEVRIALHGQGSHVVLEVADNGIGFPPDIDFRHPSTLGLRLVCILAEQIQGTIELDRREGTRFVVRFDTVENP